MILAKFCNLERILVLESNFHKCKILRVCRKSPRTIAPDEVNQEESALDM